MLADGRTMSSLVANGNPSWLYNVYHVGTLLLASLSDHVRECRAAGGAGPAVAVIQSRATSH
jgi:hypothetical protein